MLAFIHLSDIHFTKYSGDQYDIDQDLRDELLRDISVFFKRCIHRVDGVLICGDIAFSGQEPEYVAATSFLDRIFETVQLEKSRVFCVPGNHDVDRSIAKKGMSVKHIQDTLKNQISVEAYDKCLEGIFRTDTDIAALYSPIGCYNEKFAAQYSCSLAPGKAKWEQDLPLDAHYKLRLVGINSTITSNEEDNLPDGSEEQMRISHMQVPSREDNTVCLSLCHHPPECWFDPDHKIRQIMNRRVAVQLYGHKHLQTIKQEGNSLIVGSGAANPSRMEDEWIPRYNWITLDVKENAGKAVLHVKIFPRILDKCEDQFEADKNSCSSGQEFLEMEISLSNQDVEAIMQNEEAECEHNESSKISADSWERSFVYDFMNLPFFRREYILQKLNLIQAEDEGLTHTELLEPIIYRAKEKKIVDELLREIERMKG